MRSLAELETVFELPRATPDADARAAELLQASEEVLEHWITARGRRSNERQARGFSTTRAAPAGCKRRPKLQCLS